MSPTATRLTFGTLLLTAFLLFWQATQLDSWGMFGPGEGLFPMLTTGACCVFAAALQLLPQAGQEAQASSEPEEEGPVERRTFRFYVLAMILLPIASAWLGFILTSLLLVMTLSWGAEQRGWRGALAFGLLCGVVGVVGFGGLLGASLPEGKLDTALLRLLH